MSSRREPRHRLLLNDGKRTAATTVPLTSRASPRKRRETNQKEAPLQVVSARLPYSGSPPSSLFRALGDSAREDGGGTVVRGVSPAIALASSDEEAAAYIYERRRQQCLRAADRWMDHFSTELSQHDALEQARFLVAKAEQVARSSIVMRHNTTTGSSGGPSPL